MTLFGEAAKNDLQGYKPRDVSDLLWANASVMPNTQHGKFMVAVDNYIEEHWAKFSPLEVANTVWSYAKLRVYDEFVDHVPDRLLDELCSSPIERVASESAASSFMVAQSKTSGSAGVDAGLAKNTTAMNSNSFKPSAVATKPSNTKNSFWMSPKEQMASKKNFTNIFGYSARPSSRKIQN